MSFEWTPAESATYNIWIAKDADGNDVVTEGSTTVDIGVNAHAPTGNFMISSINAVNCDQSSWTTDGSGNIIGDVLSKSLVLSPSIANISGNKVGSASFIVRVYRKDGDSWSSISPSYTLSTSNFASGAVKKWNNLNFGEVGYGQYKVVLTDGSTPYDERYILNLTKGYKTLDAEGTEIFVKTASDAVTVGDGVTAVDLSGFDFSDVTPNSNPNTLYIFSSSQTPPASLDGKNVVVDGVAANITLTDGNAFCSPIDFTANNISYTRTFDEFYNAGKNWTTISLPFAASEINNGSPMIWTGVDKQFWIMKFVGESGSTVTFDYATNPLEANVPYIIALPGDGYGDYSLVGKNMLTFSATNAEIMAGAKAATTCDNYKFVGTTVNPSLTNVYALNAAGDMFEKGNATIEPFRAYFAPTTTATTATSLGISFVGSGNTTGIDAIRSIQPVNGNGAVYNLNGQRVETPTKGLYIVNGKKVIIK
ncbi:MAG: hypothetical protein IJV13_01280 [Prevotella sp.]|nr:hypothetical protein [Prevotella sp.]